MNPNNENSKPAPHTSPPEGQWTTGLYDCCEDPTNCWVTCICPVVTFGRIAEIVDQGQTSCFRAARNYMIFANVGLGPLYACTYRVKLRGLYSLPREPCADCCVHHFCFWCALCQEYRELKNRGVNPSLGWTISKAQKKKGETTTPPVPPPGMTR